MSHGADHAARSSGGPARITKWGNLFSYFPCSPSKFPARAKQIPCFISAGIRLEILGFTPDFAAISYSGRQQSTISLHNSLFEGSMMPHQNDRDCAPYYDVQGRMV
jgi:hypothetical protein